MNTKKLKAIPLFIIVFFLVVSSLGLSVKASESDVPYVADTVGILSDSEYYELLNRAETISSKHSVGVYAIVVEDYEDFGYDVGDASNNIFYDYNLGYPPAKSDGDNEAILFLMSMNDRDYDIRVKGEKANGAITSAGFDYLEESFLPDLGDNYWYAGLSRYLDATDYLLDLAEAGTPMEKSHDASYVFLTIGIILGGIIGVFFNIQRLKKKLISVETASTASNYVEGNINLSVNTDRYLYTTTQVIKHSKDKGSGGGGGSHRSGKF